MNYDEVYEMFEDSIDTYYPPITMFGKRYNASEVLRTVDPAKFEAELEAYVEDNFLRYTHMGDTLYARGDDHDGY